MIDQRIAIWSLAAFVGAMIVAMPDPRAAELRVLSAGAATAAVTEIAERFRVETGTDVKATFDTVGMIEKQLREGVPADVVILSGPVIEALERSGKIAAASRADLGRVGIGVAVRRGAPPPDIATADSFRRSLLAAKSVVYADPAKGASSGIYLTELLDRLGIADAVKAKATLLPGGYVVELVAKGGAEIGIHQISEILPVKGVTLVGPLPPELQQFTLYAAGITTETTSSGIAAAFIARLTDADGTATFKHAGFEPPAR
jgi:molybdate transport system substrate-binding protein